MAATGYTTGDPNKVNRSGDTMTGELVLPDSSPDTALAASSRGYVDNTAQAVTAASETRYVNATGDTMTGPLNLSSGGVDVDVQEALSSVLSTGVVRGGEMNIADNTSIAISGLVGYIVDTVTDPTDPTVTRVEANNQTAELTGDSLTRTVTWWRMQSDGSLVQQGTKPTNTQRRTSLMLGATSYDTVTGALVECQTLPDIATNPINQLGDLFNALGPFRISGLRVSAAGANLSLSHSTGEVFARAFNHFNGPTLTRDPHTVTDISEATFSFRRILRAPGPSTPPLVTTLDPANYDLNGTLTAVGGGAGSATIQRVWLIPTSDDNPAYVVQYGQSVYSTLANAVAAVGAGTFVPHPITDDALLMAYVCLIRTATNLSDPAQATIIHPGRFPTP